MGKGTIISHIADGQYNVTLKYNREALDAAIAVLQARATLLTDEILNETDALKKRLLQLQLLSVQKRIDYLTDIDHVPADATVTAWCADLTTDLTGDVGLIEIGRERANGVNIQPGYEDNAVFDAARDGQITPLMAQDSAATFYNLAMLPGAQKWKPTHLYGAITAIDYDADTCSVTLDAISSSQQALSLINGAYGINDVPIDYMDCNAAAFVVSDRVIVFFEGYSWDTPKVIGFEEEPKQCCWAEPWDFDAALSATRVPVAGHPTGSTVERLSPLRVWVLQDPGGGEPGFPYPDGAFTIENDNGQIRFYKPQFAVPVTYGYLGDEEPSTPYSAAATFPYPTGWGVEPQPIFRPGALRARITVSDIVTDCRATNFWRYSFGTSVAVTISAKEPASGETYFFTIYFFSENFLCSTLSGVFNSATYLEGKYCWADEAETIYGTPVSHAYQESFVPGGYWKVTSDHAYFAYLPFGSGNARYLDFPFPVNVYNVEVVCFVGNHEGNSPEFEAIIDSIEIC